YIGNELAGDRAEIQDLEQLNSAQAEAEPPGHEAKPPIPEPGSVRRHGHHAKPLVVGRQQESPDGDGCTKGDEGDEIVEDDLLQEWWPTKDQERSNAAGREDE